MTNQLTPQQLEEIRERCEYAEQYTDLRAYLLYVTPILKETVPALLAHIAEQDKRMIGLEKIIEHDRLYNLETIKPWVEKHGVPYDCGWRDAMDRKIERLESVVEAAKEVEAVLNRTMSVYVNSESMRKEKERVLGELFDALEAFDSDQS